MDKSLDNEKLIQALKEEVHKLTKKLEVKEKIEAECEDDLHRLDERLRRSHALQDQVKLLEKNLAEANEKYGVLGSKYDSLIIERNQLEAALTHSSERSSSDEAATAASLKVSLENALTKINALQLQQAETDTHLINEREKNSLTSQKLAICERELLDTTKHRTELEKHLAESREKIQDLNLLLEEAQMNLESYRNASAANQTQHGNKGNSLFAKVNDQRLKMEHQAASLKRQVDELKKENSGLKLKLHKTIASATHPSHLKTSRECMAIEAILSDTRRELKKAEEKLQRAAVTVPIHSADSSVKFLEVELSQCKTQVTQERLRKVMLENQLIDMEKSNNRLLEENAQLRAYTFELQMKVEEVQQEQKSPDFDIVSESVSLAISNRSCDIWPPGSAEKSSLISKTPKRSNGSDGDDKAYGDKKFSFRSSLNEGNDSPDERKPKSKNGRRSLDPSDANKDNIDPNAMGKFHEDVRPARRRGRVICNVVKVD